MADPRLSSELFMSVPPVVDGKEQSFEELRIEDYLKAYTATGKPPPPCPQTPTWDDARSKLGLPPLFKPHPIYTQAGPEERAGEVASTSTLPEIQLLRPLRDAGQIYMNIVVQSEFSKFSPEELRHYAYSKGKNVPLNPIPPIPDPVPMTGPNIVTNVPLQTPPATPQVDPGEIYAVDGTDALVTISTSQEYSMHSLEELRVAYLRNARQLTSREIFALSSPTATTSSISPPHLTPTAFSFSSPAGLAVSQRSPFF
ncbi:hypothetical protein JAAARDRAFT_308885 [Jaapia argillacea MUCL 33604]|uniref:Uncharacterized protein n=1 Tax=Jaapia argillacea MUCL 33604 TaxID=933084 RepID=A0A067PYG5_9AGAM|nr:hypothetical protein JAAARDRAFT_308885 [Jaapia argillacea MUCL 33604]